MSIEIRVVDERPVDQNREQRQGNIWSTENSGLSGVQSDQKRSDYLRERLEQLKEIELSLEDTLNQLEDLIDDTKPDLRNIREYNDLHIDVRGSLKRTDEALSELINNAEAKRSSLEKEYDRAVGYIDDLEDELEKLEEEEEGTLWNTEQQSGEDTLWSTERNSRETYVWEVERELWSI